MASTSDLGAGAPIGGTLQPDKPFPLKMEDPIPEAYLSSSPRSDCSQDFDSQSNNPDASDQEDEPAFHRLSRFQEMPVQTGPKKAKDNRQFQLDWLDEFPWLRFDSEQQLMYCVFCRSSTSSGCLKGFLGRGMTRIKKQTVIVHSVSKKHNLARKSMASSLEEPSRPSTSSKPPSGRPVNAQRGQSRPAVNLAKRQKKHGSDLSSSSSPGIGRSIRARPVFNKSGGARPAMSRLALRRPIPSKPPAKRQRVQLDFGVAVSTLAGAPIGRTLQPDTPFPLKTEDFIHDACLSGSSRNNGDYSQDFLMQSTSQDTSALENYPVVQPLSEYQDMPVPTALIKVRKEPKKGKKETRHFQLHWLSEFPWLRFDTEQQLMYCVYCRSSNSHYHKGLGKGTSHMKKHMLLLHSLSMKHNLAKRSVTGSVEEHPGPSSQRRPPAGRSVNAQRGQSRLAVNLAKRQRKSSALSSSSSLPGIRRSVRAQPVISKFGGIRPVVSRPVLSRPVLNNPPPKRQRVELDLGVAVSTLAGAPIGGTLQPDTPFPLKTEDSIHDAYLSSYPQGNGNCSQDFVTQSTGWDASAPEDDPLSLIHRLSGFQDMPVPTALIKVRKEPKKETRHFQFHWLSEFPWLRFDSEQQLMFCVFCRSSSNSHYLKGLLGEGTKRMKKQTLILHNSSKRHNLARRSMAGSLEEPSGPSSPCRLPAGRPVFPGNALRGQSRPAVNLAKRQRTHSSGLSSSSLPGIGRSIRPRPVFSKSGGARPVMSRLALSRPVLNNPPARRQRVQLSTAVKLESTPPCNEEDLSQPLLDAGEGLSAHPCSFGEGADYSYEMADLQGPEYSSEPGDQERGMLMHLLKPGPQLRPNPFPVRLTKRKEVRRFFKKRWALEFKWLRYDAAKQVMYCAVCRLLGIEKAGKTGFITGISRFKKETLVTHNKSKKHNYCRKLMLNAGLDISVHDQQDWSLLSDENNSSAGPSALQAQDFHHIAPASLPTRDPGYQQAIHMPGGVHISQPVFPPQPNPPPSNTQGPPPDLAPSRSTPLYGSYPSIHSNVQELRRRVQTVKVEASEIDYLDCGSDQNVTLPMDTSDRVQRLSRSLSSLENAAGHISVRTQQDLVPLSIHKATKQHYLPRRFCHQWLKEFPWLRYEQGTMYCAYCRDVCHASTDKNLFVRGTRKFRKDTVVTHSTSKKHLKTLMIMKASRQFKKMERQQRESQAAATVPSSQGAVSDSQVIPGALNSSARVEVPGHPKPRRIIPRLLLPSGQASSADKSLKPSHQSTYRNFTKTLLDGDHEIMGVNSADLDATNVLDMTPVESLIRCQMAAPPMNASQLFLQGSFMPTQTMPPADSGTGSQLQVVSTPVFPPVNMVVVNTPIVPPSAVSLDLGSPVTYASMPMVVAPDTAHAPLLLQPSTPLLQTETTPLSTSTPPTLLIQQEQATTNKEPVSVQSRAEELIGFVNRAPSPFHVVDECRKRLRADGFNELKEKEPWDIKPLDKCFVTRNQSTIIAFAVGGKYKPGNGFTMIGAHTDSPCLKVKPGSKKVKSGYLGVGVECYGGGIWNTWFDRDLTVAGRVLVQKDGGFSHRLVFVERPILRVPNLCIHLNRSVNDNFGPNKETEIVPVLATSIKQQIDAPVTAEAESCEATTKHHPILIKLLCDELDITPEQILDFELCLTDTQPATIGGALKEFIFAPRLDNQLNCFASLKGLIGSCETPNSLENDTNIRMMLLYDHEEVGSSSAHGANSSLTEWIMRRLSAGGSPTAFEEAVPKSFMISADQAHAIHPNYPEKHEDNHKVALHKGPVLKYNSNQRYATNAVTASIVKLIAKDASVELQDVVVRNDSACGSTIGPMLSSKLGLRTLDIGSPQLSMHSIREMCCTSGVSQSCKLFQGFYEKFPAVDAKVIVD